VKAKHFSSFSVRESSNPYTSLAIKPCLFEVQKLGVPRNCRQEGGLGLSESQTFLQLQRKRIIKSLHIPGHQAIFV